jgi:hypothetical protein
VNLAKVAAIALLASSQTVAHAGTGAPKSVLELYNSIPALPTSASEAAQWVQHQKVVHPGLLALKAEIQAHKRRVGAMCAGKPAVVVQDSVAAKAAADAGFAYTNEQVARIEAHRVVWNESAQAVARIHAQPLSISAGKPQMEYDHPECDASCVARWHGYADKMYSQIVARDTAVLLARRAGFEQERLALAAPVKAANKRLLAVNYGADSHNHVHRSRIVGYDAAIVGDIERLVASMEDIVKAAARRASCGKQIVLTPDSACRASVTTASR